MNTANYLGHSDWQLPTAPLNDPNSGCSGTGPAPYREGFAFGCNTGALGFLYYTALGFKAPDTAVPIPPNEVGPFKNFHPNLYWSGSRRSTSTYLRLLRKRALPNRCGLIERACQLRCDTVHEESVRGHEHQSGSCARQLHRRYANPSLEGNLQTGSERGTDFADGVCKICEVGHARRKARTRLGLRHPKPRQT